jgi:hypothetical protein
VQVGAERIDLTFPVNKAWLGGPFVNSGPTQTAVPQPRSNKFLPVPEREAAVAEFIEAPKGRAKGITL